MDLMSRNLRNPRAEFHMARVIADTSGICYADAAVPGQAPQSQITPDQQNQLARNLIFSNAKPIIQAVGNKSFATVTAGNNVYSVAPLQIGFLRRFIVVVTGTITNTGAGILTLSPNGADNLLSNITFNDFTGNPRHNASGRAFSYVEGAKYQRIPGAAYTSDSVSGYGSIIASNVAPATIANAGTGTVTRIFEIPIMVDTGKFMAGGMWLGVNNQSTMLNLTGNLTPVVVTAADPLNAIYTGVSGTLTNVTMTVYQDYWNNLPKDKNNNPILPMNDIATAYMITETNSGLTFASGQQSQWNFPTFSKLLGTYFAYDNAGVLNPGTDLSTIRLVVSNYSIIKEYSPLSLSREMRNVYGADLPKGQYAITSRMHNLDVSQYPSLQLQITPSAATAGAYAMVTTEILRPMQYMAAASGVGGA
jgi:hypothetical protein